MTGSLSGPSCGDWEEDIWPDSPSTPRPASPPPKPLAAASPPSPAPAPAPHLSPTRPERGRRSGCGHLNYGQQALAKPLAEQQEKTTRGGSIPDHQRQADTEAVTYLSLK